MIIIHRNIIFILCVQIILKEGKLSLIWMTYGHSSNNYNYNCITDPNYGVASLLNTGETTRTIILTTRSAITI